MQNEMTTNTTMFKTEVIIKATGQIKTFYGMSHHKHALDYIAKNTI